MHGKRQQENEKEYEKKKIIMNYNAKLAFGMDKIPYRMLSTGECE